MIPVDDQPGPLHGWRVLVTASSPERFCAELEAGGAVALGVPTIAIETIGNEAFDAALFGLERYDWCVVTSSNGARALFDRLDALGADIPTRLRWAAVGPRTRRALAARGIRVSAEPAAARGAAIPDAMDGVAGERVLLLRAGAASADLPDRLRTLGADVDDVVAYRTIEGPRSARDALVGALDPTPDAIVFTSGSTIRGFLAIAGTDWPVRNEIVAVCIGPVTTEIARSAGFDTVESADRPTPAGILAALERIAKRRGEDG